MKSLLHKFTLKQIISIVLVALLGIAAGCGVGFNISAGFTGQSITISAGFSMELADEQVPALVENEAGEEVYEDNIVTVEEVDGGLFEDATKGVSVTEGDYDDLGWSEWYPTDTPEAFRNATIGRCIIANNRYGAQCVSLARVYWWSYANRDVSTCGTGMAKGMMNCAEQNAGDDFDIYWADAKWDIQAGDWLIFDGGQYGHVGMALGPVTNGYVALLGENQGGSACPGGGSSTNIINISVKNLIGYYRPKAYIKPEPAPEPEPTPAPAPTPSTDTYKVVKGDTLGGIARKLGWYTGKKLFGDDGYAQALADYNGIKNRGLIYPGQIIRRK